MQARYEIEIARTGYQSLKRIRDRKILREIAGAIDGLATRPEEQGKALRGPLEGLRSLRTSGDRFRVLYRVDADALEVWVLLAGRRRPGREEDVYEIARRLLGTFLRE